MDIRPSDDDRKRAFDETQSLLKAYPNVKVVMAIASPAVPGAAEAVKQSGRTDVKVTGLGLPNDAKPYLKDGVLDSVVLWNTQDLGYLTLYAASALGAGHAQGRSDVVRGRPPEDAARRGRQHPARHAVHVHEGQRRPLRLLTGGAMSSVTLDRQRSRARIDADPDMPLLWALRDLLGLTGTKYGCGEALCGACTVHLDGEAGALVRDAADRAPAGRKVTTIEGLSPRRPAPAAAGVDRGRRAAVRLLPGRARS